MEYRLCNFSLSKNRRGTIFLNDIVIAYTFGLRVRAPVVRPGERRVYPSISLKTQPDPADMPYVWWNNVEQNGMPAPGRWMSTSSARIATAEGRGPR